MNHFNKCFVDLRTHGRLVSPRGQQVLELEDYTYHVPANLVFCNMPSRKLNLAYIKEEFLWYLRGRLDDLSITKHAKLWESLVVDGRLNSNYGHYWFAKGGLKWVVDELVRDPDSRRAVIPILGSLDCHLTQWTKDVPCTESVGFRLRDGELRMTVHMRSQDAVFGMGNDVPCFAFLQRMVHALLLAAGLQVRLGGLAVTATSFHIYERHFNLLDTLAVEPITEWALPSIRGIGEVRRMLEPAQIPEPHDLFLNWLHLGDCHAA